MHKISKIVVDWVEEDESILNLGSQELINWSSYARKIRPEIEKIMGKVVKEGSIVASLVRYFRNKPSLDPLLPNDKIIERLSIHSNLEGLTLERTESNTTLIQKMYSKLHLEKENFITITQGVNEITVIAEKAIALQLRGNITQKDMIYDKRQLVGVSIKFHLKYLEVPNILFQLHRKISLKRINIIELISTATELTFIIEKKDLSKAMESLQKNFC